MTLDDIKAACLDPAVAPQAADANAPNGDMLRPFWVVVVNPRRQPPAPKFHTGHVSQASADATVVAKQKVADEQAKTETLTRGKDWKAFRYFAIARPKGGVI
jgi:hypothetical protein